MRKNTCDILLAWYKMKLFLHRVVTWDKKWFIFRISSARIMDRPRRIIHIHHKPNRFCRNTILSIEWDQRDVVCFDLLKPGETVNTKCYQQQLVDLNPFLLGKRPEYRRRQRKVIFLHNIWQNRFTIR